MTRIAGVGTRGVFEPRCGTKFAGWTLEAVAECGQLNGVVVFPRLALLDREGPPVPRT